MSRTTDFGDSSKSRAHGTLLAVALERGGQHVLQGPRVRDLGQALHPLLVVHAVGLHLGHGLLARGALLRAQHLARILQRGLRKRDDVERVAFVLGVEKSSAASRNGESGWSSAKSSGTSTVVAYDAAPSSPSERSTTPASMSVWNTSSARTRSAAFSSSVCSRVGDELRHARVGVAALHHLGEHHGMRDAQARLERLGRGLDQALEGLLCSR